MSFRGSWRVRASGARTHFRKIPKAFFCLSSLSPFDQQPQMFGAGPSCAQKPRGGQPRDIALAAIAENVNAQVNTIDAEPAELNRLLEVLRT